MALHDPVARATQPDPLPAVRPAGAAIANGTLYTLNAVGGMLGHRGRALPWLCRLVDAMIVHDGFPRPLPLALPDGSTSRRAHKHSRWPAAAVDAWLAAQTPADLIDAVTATALAQASARLDARAIGLTVIAGGRP